LLVQVAGVEPASLFIGGGF